MNSNRVKLIKIKVIKNPKGNIIKFTNKKKIKFKFGECYFSEVIKNKFKGWKFHNARNQFLSIASGKLLFQYKYKKEERIKERIISYPNNLYGIYIPKKVFYNFKSLSSKRAVIINIIDEIVE